MNLLQLPITAGGVGFGDAEIKVEKSILAKTKEKTITVGLRPEDVVVSKTGLPLEVDVVEELGADAFIYGSVVLGGVKADVTVRVESNGSVKAGSKVFIAPAGNAHLFDVESGERLN
jgi:multiple sugar transport system ATP-binding protein